MPNKVNEKFKFTDSANDHQDIIDIVDHNADINKKNINEQCPPPQSSPEREDAHKNDKEITDNDDVEFVEPTSKKLEHEPDFMDYADNDNDNDDNEEEKKESIVTNDNNDEEYSNLKITKIVTKTDADQDGIEYTFPKDVIDQCPKLILSHNAETNEYSVDRQNLTDIAGFFFNSIINSVHYGYETPVDPAPPTPNTNLLTKRQAMLLVSGYIRNNFVINQVPNDIMDLFVEFFSTNLGISYHNTLDILLNRECCIGVYDFKISRWRPAVYMNHWDKSKRIMVRYIKDPNTKDPNTSDKFKTIKDFPVNYIMEDGERFKASIQELKDQSNLTKDEIDGWAQRKKIKN